LEHGQHRAREGAVCFCHAEDGIRDRNVTGVQTCALPISIVMDMAHDEGGTGKWAYALDLASGEALDTARILERAGMAYDDFLQAIGRASCRDRVDSAGADAGDRARERTRPRAFRDHSRQG